MAVAQTSIDAYRSLRTEDITERQEKVLRFIAEHPDCTAEQVFRGLGYSTPNSTSPRITELLDLNMIEVTGRKSTSSGRNAMTYRVRDWVFVTKEDMERESRLERYTAEAEEMTSQYLEELDEDRRREALIDSRPTSRWTKAEIIRSCEENGVPRASIDVLKRMPLGEIKQIALVYHRTYVTGSKTTLSRTRHTRFWRIDYDFVSSLANEGDSE